MRTIAALVSVVLAAGAASPAAAAPTGLTAQVRRLVAMPYDAFLTVKRTVPAAPFDWSTDGCSRTPAEWAAIFDGPCEQHDFGYRNFGNGLRLDRTEARRAWIDGRLLAGLRQVCTERYRSVRLVLCRTRARLMWAAVRTFNDWSG
ncbi:MAG TPA: phospholipase A2 [Solirubrobacteraceae bacterium]